MPAFVVVAVLVRGVVAVLAMVVVMVGVAVVLQKIGVNVELGVEVKTMQVKHFFDRHLAKMHGFLRCARVHVL